MNDSSLYERLKSLSEKLENDPRLWMEIEAILRTHLIEKPSGMSTLGNTLEALKDVVGDDAIVLRLVGVDRREYESFVNPIRDELPTVVKLLGYLRSTYGATIKRFENMARFGPFSWHSTSFSSGPKEDITLEFERADGERFALHLRGKENVKRFVYSILESLRRAGVNLKDIVEDLDI